MGCCTRRGIWQTIAIFSMIISLLMVALSICALLTYYCIFNPHVSQFKMDSAYFTYVVYYYSSKCVDLKSNFIVWKPDPSERTWGWSVAYLVVNTVWFLTSIVLLRAVNYWQSKIGAWMTYPWLLMTLGVLITDVAASVIYGLDYTNLETVDMLFNYVKISYPGKDDYGFVYWPLPTIIMVALYSKFIIIWLLILISFLVIIILLFNVGKPAGLVLSTRAPVDYYTPTAAVNPAFESEMTEIDISASQHVPPNNHDVPQYFEDIPWNSRNYQQQVIPRISTRFVGTYEEYQKRSPTSPLSYQKSVNWPSDLERSQSPPGILKAGNSMAWSYTPNWSHPHPHTEEPYQQSWETHPPNSGQFQNYQNSRMDY